MAFWMLGGRRLSALAWVLCCLPPILRRLLSQANLSLGTHSQKACKQNCVFYLEGLPVEESNLNNLTSLGLTFS